MKWSYWICLYTQTHCVARGLRSTTIAAYSEALTKFRQYVRGLEDDPEPDEVSARLVLEYVEYLRRARNNGDSAINRTVTILKGFYRAMVAMGHLENRANPLLMFPKIRAASRKLPVVLSEKETTRLLEQPGVDTVLGLRDRAILTLLYGTGIRASECASLTVEHVDFDDRTIRVTGKGGHQRVVPLNDTVIRVMRRYADHRGRLKPEDAFFRGRSGESLSRKAVYQRVCKHAREAKIPKRVSPHKLRHTFATHLVRRKVDLVTIRDLLGHRQITSTQIYLHTTAEDLRHAAEIHPIRQLMPLIEDILPQRRLPIEHRIPPECRTG